MISISLKQEERAFVLLQGRQATEASSLHDNYHCEVAACQMSLAEINHLMTLSQNFMKCVNCFFALTVSGVSAGVGNPPALD